MRPFPVVACAATLLARVLIGDAGHCLSESQFLEPLAGGHPAVVALTAALSEAEAEAISARALANPELAASREAPGDLEQTDIALSWQLPHPGRRRLAAAGADARVEAARARLEVERVRLRQTLREVFARWSIATARVARLARWSAELERLAERERERAAGGEASGLDARRLALAAGEARGRLARAEAERQEAFAAARVWRDDLAPEELPELPPLTAPSAEMAGSADVAAARAELAAAAAERDLASQVLAMPTLVGGWQRQKTGGEVLSGPTLEIRWALPLFDRQAGQRAAARARLEAKGARLELVQREYLRQRDGALAAYAILSAAAIEARLAATAGAAVVDAAAAAFQAGESTVTDLLDALRSATEAELAGLELHGEALAAYRRLEQLTATAAFPGDAP
jgi:cobalt-zinc-cadmium efflux system outer membrane protein